MDQRNATQNGIEYETVRSSTKLLLAAVMVLILLSLASFLPGIDLLIPATPITLFAVAGAVASLAIAGLLVYSAPGFARIVRTALDGPRHLVEDVAAIVQLLVVLAAVLVAHRGLAPAVTPLFDGLAWVYDVFFMVLALPLLVVIAARMYVSIDPAAEYCADALAESDDGPGDATR